MGDVLNLWFQKFNLLSALAVISLILLSVSCPLWPVGIPKYSTCSATATPVSIAVSFHFPRSTALDLWKLVRPPVASEYFSMYFLYILISFLFPTKTAVSSAYPFIASLVLLMFIPLNFGFLIIAELNKSAIIVYISGDRGHPCL